MVDKYNQLNPRIPDMHTSAQVWVLRHLATQPSPSKSTASDSTHAHSMAAWHTRLFVMAPSTQNSTLSHQSRIAPCSTAWPQQCRSKPELSKSPPTASIKHSTYTSIHRIIGCCTQTHLFVGQICHTYHFLGPHTLMMIVHAQATHFVCV